MKFSSSFQHEVYFGKLKQLEFHISFHIDTFLKTITRQAIIFGLIAIATSLPVVNDPAAARASAPAPIPANPSAPASVSERSVPAVEVAVVDVTDAEDSEDDGETEDLSVPVADQEGSENFLKKLMKKRNKWLKKCVKKGGCQGNFQTDIQTRSIDIYI